MIRELLGWCKENWGWLRLVLALVFGAALAVQICIGLGVFDLPLPLDP